MDVCRRVQLRFLRTDKDRCRRMECYIIQENPPLNLVLMLGLFPALPSLHDTALGYVHTPGFERGAVRITCFAQGHKTRLPLATYRP